MYVSVVIVFQRILNSSKYLLTKILYMFYFPLTHATFPAHRILLLFVVLLYLQLWHASGT